MSTEEIKAGMSDWLLGIVFAIVAMLFSGWIYMLVISLFSPISYKNALVISLILNMIGLAFNHGRSMNRS